MTLLRFSVPGAELQLHAVAARVLRLGDAQTAFGAETNRFTLKLAVVLLAFGWFVLNFPCRCNSFAFSTVHITADRAKRDRDERRCFAFSTVHITGRTPI